MTPGEQAIVLMVIGAVFVALIAIVIYWSRRKK